MMWLKMSKEFREYTEAEIPGIKKYPPVLRALMLFKIRRENPSADAVYMFRYCLMFIHGSSLVKKIVARRYMRLLVYRYGIFFDFKDCSHFGKGLKFPHPSSIIIGSDVKIGENCVIYQNVTIGAARAGDAAKGKYPEIGNNCTLFAGCKVLGSVKVADGTTVGANAVLLKSTEKDSTYAGVPAERIK